MYNCHAAPLNVDIKNGGKNVEISQERKQIGNPQILGLILLLRARKSQFRKFSWDICKSQIRKFPQNTAQQKFELDHEMVHL